MLHIALLILKIVGIILLAALGLVLLILCAVLFVPVTYRAEVEKRQEIHGKATMGWLFRIVTIRYLLDWNGEAREDLSVRLFGIRICTLRGEKKKPKKGKKKKSQKEKRKEKLPEEETSGSREEEVKPAKEVQEKKVPDKKAENIGWTEQKEAPPENEKQEKKDGSGRKKTSRKKKPSIFQKLSYAISSICDKIKHIWESIRNISSRPREIKSRVRKLSDRKDEYLEFWKKEAHVRARQACYREARYLWKKLRPKKVEGTIRFGMEDPSQTGQIYGLVCMLYQWYPEKFYVEPDFENKILEGNLKIKGCIRAYVLALVCGRLFFNKDVRRMYHAWKQM